MQNEFDKEEKYKLFRTVKEILHPTISKKNISNYKIIIDENLLPLRVFYPIKVSNLQDVIIYIHGDCKITKSKGKYSDIAANLSKELDKTIISVDYPEAEKDLKKMYEELYKTTKAVYDELISIGRTKDNITFMGDSTGASIILNIYASLQKEKKEIGKLVLFYPVLSGEYFGKTQFNSIKENNTVDHDLIRKLKTYYEINLKEEDRESETYFHLKRKDKINYPKTLILIGNVDPLIDEAQKLSDKDNNIICKIVSFANHGFLNTNDKEIIKEYMTDLIEFMKNEK